MFRRRVRQLAPPAQRTGTEAVIHLDGVSLTYPGPPPVEALKPCHLTVMAGDYLTIVGRSGSGKSTLLNVLGLLDRPTGGRYELDGVDTSELSDRERSAMRATRIGFVFQAFHLLPHRTAEENVALSTLYRGVHRRERIENARNALDRVGLAHRRHALPSEMSGGERQRAAVARALAQEPSLLLCDEPTGNLDNASTDTVLELIDGLRSDGLTVLVITHDDRVASLGSRRIAISDGHLREVTAVGTSPVVRS